MCLVRHRKIIFSSGKARIGRYVDSEIGKGLMAAGQAAKEVFMSIRNNER